MQARLKSRGRLTLSFAARARLGLKAGDHLSVTVQDDDAIILKRHRIAASTSLRGLLAKPQHALTSEEMDADVGAHLAAKQGPPPASS